MTGAPAAPDAGREVGPDSPAAPLATIEHTHRDVSGGTLRPAVFGAMDGLVSNFALIAGVVGGTGGSGLPHYAVVLAGLAGLVAGAFSMAAGEYTSVASQSELALAEIETERLELQRRPREEEEELAQLYVARGVDVDLARQVARQLSLDPEQALRVHAREELGVDPSDLPSPAVAAWSSFVSFAVGALVPLAPYLLSASTLWPALVLTLAALFGLGAVVGRMTARPWWRSGLRQLLLGGAAAAVTYAVGSLAGAALG